MTFFGQMFMSEINYKKHFLLKRKKKKLVFILALNGSSHGGSTVNTVLAACDTYAPSSCV